MKYITKITGIALISIATISHSGLHYTTVHSRANCLNNESITWWSGHPYTWKVVSIHKHYQDSSHLIDTGFNYNDRVAAIHWGEGVHGGFEVWGYHYIKSFRDSIPFDTTYANTCNIIEGW